MMFSISYPERFAALLMKYGLNLQPRALEPDDAPHPTADVDPPVGLDVETLTPEAIPPTANAVIEEQMVDNLEVANEHRAPEAGDLNPTTANAVVARINDVDLEEVAVEHRAPEAGDPNPTTANAVVARIDDVDLEEVAENELKIASIDAPVFGSDALRIHRDDNGPIAPKNPLPLFEKTLNLPRDFKDVTGYWFELLDQKPRNAFLKLRIDFGAEITSKYASLILTFLERYPQLTVCFPFSYLQHVLLSAKYPASFVISLCKAINSDRIVSLGLNCGSFAGLENNFDCMVMRLFKFDSLRYLSFNGSKLGLVALALVPFLNTSALIFLNLSDNSLDLLNLIQVKELMGSIGQIKTVCFPLFYLPAEKS
jgi:ribosomal protein L12E/L44/L45/RPP1/RPP2